MYLGGDETLLGLECGESGAANNCDDDDDDDDELPLPSVQILTHLYDYFVKTRECK